jgi:hypothetical protein
MARHSVAAAPDTSPWVERRLFLSATAGDGAFFFSLSLNEKARLRGQPGFSKTFGIDAG